MSAVFWSFCALIYLVVGARNALAAGATDWPSVDGTDHATRYSPLREVNENTVGRLGLAWYLDLPGEQALEATPVAVAGVLYFSGSFGRTYAADARTGRQLWEFDPKSGEYRPDGFRYSGSLGGHRGVAFWRGRIFVAATDGRLFALNAKTGAQLWNVQTFDGPQAHMTISGAPRVIHGKVLIGHNGDPGTRGYLTAYDATTGRFCWRFFTVPGNPARGFENDAMAMAAKTWQGEWWKSGGNGAVWDGITYDPEFNRIYIGTANCIDANGCGTSGSDNLFVSSVVALDANSGKYVWHYQENPRGDWDYDSSMSMVLAALKIGGVTRKVILHAPKNGFFYVIDRVTGKLLSAEKYTKVTWAERVDLTTGRPVETPGVVQIWPSFIGAHNWQAMSFDPQTGLAYLPTIRLGMQIIAGTGVRYDKIDQDDGTGSLLAWDPVSQTKRWEVRYSDSMWNGGTLVTAGNLVFQGTGRGQFAAFNATTGERLWAFDAGLGIVAAPSTYELNGTQYLTVLVGYGGLAGVIGNLCDYGWRYGEQPRRLLTFALDRHVTLPAAGPPRHRVLAVDDPDLAIDAAAVQRGQALYHDSSIMCFACHGPKLQNSGSMTRDLRESTLALDARTFDSILHDGTLANVGMPTFADLTHEQVHDIYLYVRQRAREANGDAAQ